MNAVAVECSPLNSARICRVLGKVEDMLQAIMVNEQFTAFVWGGKTNDQCSYHIVIRWVVYVRLEESSFTVNIDLVRIQLYTSAGCEFILDVCPDLHHSRRSMYFKPR